MEDVGTALWQLADGIAALEPRNQLQVHILQRLSLNRNERQPRKIKREIELSDSPRRTAIRDVQSRCLNKTLLGEYEKRFVASIHSFIYMAKASWADLPDKQ